MYLLSLYQNLVPAFCTIHSAYAKSWHQMRTIRATIRTTYVFIIVVQKATLS